jgi:hypothetical protein
VSRTEEAATRRLNPTTHSQRAIPSDVRQPSQETPSNPRDNSEIGDSDSGSSNAEKYAGNPVKQYNRALKGRRKKSLTLHSVVTPQEGRLAYQRGKENGGWEAAMTTSGCGR